jgi:hypothetical protein
MPAVSVASTGLAAVVNGIHNSGIAIAFSLMDFAKKQQQYGTVPSIIRH